MSIIIKRQHKFNVLTVLPPVSEGKVEEEADYGKHNTGESQEIKEPNQPVVVGVNYHHRCPIRGRALCVCVCVCVCVSKVRRQRKEEGKTTLGGIV